MKLTVVGCGSLGTALIELALSSKVLSRKDITLIERNVDDQAHLGRHFQVNVFSGLKGEATKDEVILLAIKPKDLKEIAPALTSYITPNRALLISALAGVSLEKLKARLSGFPRIARVMPNLGVQVGLGVTGAFFPSEFENQDSETVKELFGVSGIVIPVESEATLDLVTAISGSGPAYICAFLEALEKVAVERGLEKKSARMSVTQTLRATATILETQDLAPDVLRTRVTSPGGVTEAALIEFEKKNLLSMIDAAVAASIARSIELDKLA